MPKKLYFTLDLHHLRIDDYKEDDGYLEVKTNNSDKEIPVSLSVSRNEDDWEGNKEEFLGQADLVIKDGKLVAKLPSTLEGLRSAYKKTESALKEFCIDFLRNILSSYKVSSFDFSAITEDEYVEDSNQNKIEINRWTRHDIWYSVYPFSFGLKDGRLSFLCCDDEDDRDETVPQNDFTADDLACLVNVLKAYLESPDWCVETEGEIASLTYIGESTTHQLKTDGLVTLQ